MDENNAYQGGTIMFDFDMEKAQTIDRIMKSVQNALIEKGYNPVNQIVGYVMSGDPTYITSHKDARTRIQDIERDELLEELVKSYLAGLSD